MFIYMWVIKLEEELQQIENKYAIIEDNTLTSSFNTLENNEFFKDFGKLVYPNNWNKSISIKWNSNIKIKLMKPHIEKDKVSVWKLQIWIYSNEDLLAYLNANIYPQSWRIRFSWIRKQSDKITLAGNKLLSLYKNITQIFNKNNEWINILETEWQRKLDVVFLLSKNWFVAKNKSKSSEFKLYRCKDKWYYFTTSKNTHKWDNAKKFTRLYEDPVNNGNFKFIWNYYIGPKVRYILNNE